jgi:hypothetical protein
MSDKNKLSQETIDDVLASLADRGVLDRADTHATGAWVNVATPNPDVHPRDLDEPTPPAYVCPLCGCYQEKQIAACGLENCPAPREARTLWDAPRHHAVRPRLPSWSPLIFVCGVMVGFFLAFGLIMVHP